MATSFEEVNPSDLKQRLETYYRTYYAELHEMMSSYSAISEGFPYWLKGPKSVLATLCTDGVLVTHWKATQYCFAFEQDRCSRSAADAQQPTGCDSPHPGRPPVGRTEQTTHTSVSGPYASILSYPSPLARGPRKRAQESPRSDVCYIILRVKGRSDGGVAAVGHGCAAGSPFSSSPAGIRRTKVEPWSSLLSTAIVPPWASAICWAMDRPSPDPPAVRASSVR